MCSYMQHCLHTEIVTPENHNSKKTEKNIVRPESLVHLNMRKQWHITFLALFSTEFSSNPCSNVEACSRQTGKICTGLNVLARSRATGWQKGRVLKTVLLKVIKLLFEHNAEYC